ncbi:Hypothetical predicted protein [Paramuricea clavata]|uniref:Uncharacterized protein n=1 Tax=Paramuricea clavata TaxID=317549 RepID=A0A6S7H6I5_PARCT|nr:Hypothetical predicted protein [Paramuricea clavata]
MIELELRETGSLIFPPAGKAIFCQRFESNMAHETSFIVEYSDSEDDLYNGMFDSDCEGMSSAEELDLELGLFDDNSRNLDSPYSEDITVGPSEEAETYHKGGGYHLYLQKCFTSFKLEQRRNNPDNNSPERGEKYYGIVEFREALVRQICGLADYDVPPSYVSGKEKPVHEYETLHIPKLANVRRVCKVCYKAGRGQLTVSTYCSAPQCQNFLHIRSDKNCFEVWHTKEYHQQ